MQTPIETGSLFVFDMMKFLEKINTGANRLFVFIGGLFLVGMMVLTCANIFLRTVWTPIPGTFELMGFFGAVTAAMSLGYTQLKKGHIAVDVMVNSFSDSTKKVLRFINDVICIVFFMALSWQIAQKATVLMKTGEVTETLRIVYYPFTYAVAIGCAFIAFVFFVDFVRILLPGKEKVQ